MHIVFAAESDQQYIRILIADDHAMVLDGMVSIISSDSDCKVVAKALDGQRAVELFNQHLPDVAIVDIQMPKMDGIQVINAIRSTHPHAKIIVLSAYDDEEVIYQALQAGAMSYVLKEALLENLIATIKSVYAGKRIVTGEIAAKYVERTSRTPLSDRELDVLQLIAQGKTNGEIATMLTLTEGTVKVHVHNILDKLETRDRTAAVMEAVRRGILRI